MKKKHKNQREQIKEWAIKCAHFTAPEDFCDLVRWLPDPELLLGVDRVTLARWKTGKSRVPFAAAQLCRLLKGELPAFFGDFAGWRFLPDGEIFVPSWGEPIMREDVIGVWFWRKQALNATALGNENARLRKELLFYREQAKNRAALGCLYATAEVLNEREEVLP